MTDVTRVTLLTQSDCQYCARAKAVLDRVAMDHPLLVREVSLETAEGRDLAVRHGVLFAPGILLNEQPFGYGRLSERRLRSALDRR